jgi:broad specificity phosphatase PhoE
MTAPPPNKATTLTLAPFYYVRHGETDWNTRSIAQGQTDVHLNADGRTGALEAAEFLRTEDIGTICTSPLSRARDTADAIAKVTGLEPITISGLIEASFGEMEGKPTGAWREDWVAGKSCPEGAEDFEAFMARALAAINTALSYPGPVVIVAHGGVYWAIDRCLGTARMAHGLPQAVPVLHTPPEGEQEWLRIRLDGEDLWDQFE